MKLYSSNLSALINRPLQMPKFLLIHGPDEAEANATIEKLIHTIKKAHSNYELSVTKISYSDIKETPHLLYEETQSLSLFGDKKLLLIEATPHTITKEVLTILATLPTEIPIIFQAGDLTKSSSARRYFEDSTKCAAIACYKPDINRIKQIITTFFQTHNIKGEPDILEVLASMLPANEKIILSELEKLRIYNKGEQLVTIEDISQVIAQGHEFSLDNLCESMIKNDANYLTRELCRLEIAGENAVFIIRVLINFFIRALKVRLAVDNGKTLEAAITQLRPPAFFKSKSNLLLASKQFSSAMLENFIEKLITLELNCKQGSINPELRMSFILHRFMEIK